MKTTFYCFSFSPFSCINFKIQETVRIENENNKHFLKQNGPLDNKKKIDNYIWCVVHAKCNQRNPVFWNRGPRSIPKSRSWVFRFVFSIMYAFKFQEDKWKRVPRVHIYPVTKVSTGGAFADQKLAIIQDK